MRQVRGHVAMSHASCTTGKLYSPNRHALVSLRSLTVLCSTAIQVGPTCLLPDPEEKAGRFEHFGR